MILEKWRGVHQPRAILLLCATYATARTDSNSPDYRLLEDDEIGQFVRYLEIFANAEMLRDDTGVFQDNYRMVKVADSFEPNLLD